MAKHKGKGKGKGGHKPRPLKPVKRTKVVKKGTAAVAATPGQLEAAKTPFHTGDEELDKVGQEGDWRAELTALNNDYLTQNAALPQALDTIAKTSVSAAERANADAAARGIFQSSIRDTAIGDIEAQRAANTTNATSMVKAASDAYATRNDEIYGTGGEQTQYLSAYNHQATDNATAANEDRGFVVDPTEAVAATKDKTKTVLDYMPNRPGIQTKRQGLLHQKHRRANKPGSPRPAGSGRGNQQSQPNKPGKPRKPKGNKLGKF